MFRSESRGESRKRHDQTSANPFDAGFSESRGGDIRFRSFSNLTSPRSITMRRAGGRCFWQLSGGPHAASVFARPSGRIGKSFEWGRKNGRTRLSRFFTFPTSFLLPSFVLFFMCHWKTGLWRALERLVLFFFHRSKERFYTERKNSRNYRNLTIIQMNFVYST